MTIKSYALVAKNQYEEVFMDNLTQIFKLLSDDTRLRMILLLFQQDLCVCEISGVLNVPQPRVSKNLSKLRDMNLVSDERKDKFVFYSLKKERGLLTEILKQIMDQLDDYPQIQIDTLKLKDKDQYSNVCCPICEAI